MKTINPRTLFICTFLLAGAPALAQEAETPDPETAAYEAALESARQGQEAAEQALEQVHAELQRVAEQQHLAEGTEQASLSEAQRTEMRAQLSRAHEELRRASREVARAHREIELAHRGARAGFAPRAGLFQLGDKAVIGVVLGDSTDSGVPVLGVSPDGPSDRAGIQQGDVIVALMGQELAGDAQADPRAVLTQAMKEVKVGDELLITVDRDGQRIDFEVTADKREPFAWQSFVRLPSAPLAPGAPGAPLVVERIEIPQIDHEDLHEQVERLRENIERARVVVRTRKDGEPGAFENSYEYHFDSLSDIGDEALRSANVWFGLPATRGLKLAEMDDTLAAYFKADSGVLVLKAKQDNELQLRSGDVITAIGEQPVSKPADVMRALREWEPGASIEIQIKRERRNKTLDVVLPERRLGYGFVPRTEDVQVDVRVE